MKKISSTLMVIGLASLLAGCDVSVDSLVEDKQQRREILKACTEMGIKAKDDKKCQMALEAEAKAAKNAAKDFVDAVK